MQSEIRNSQIKQLLEKVKNRNYDKYLSRMTLVALRGFSHQNISFDFPVTAVVGPNGGGKSTVLGAAACAYKAIQPRMFFAKSGTFDASMENWKINYELIDKRKDVSTPIQRSASFTKYKWRRNLAERHVEVFGISRTVPLSEKKEYYAYSRSTFEIPEEQVAQLNDDVKTAVQRILGKDVSEYTKLSVDQGGQVVMYTGATAGGVKYSEFHFGAGESSIIRIIAELETIPENSLVLIEELENGLHPVATKRLVEYLIGLAQRRRHQVIFSTHSQDALEPLPDEAIWSSINGELTQGRLQIDALRTLTDKIENQLILYVEDEFAKEWAESYLRESASRDFDFNLVQVVAAGGERNAVKFHRNRSEDPSIPLPSLCYLDGDSAISASEEQNIFQFPGETPELHVIDSVLQNWDHIGGKVAVSLLQDFECSDSLKEQIDQALMTTSDPHLLYDKIGEKLGLIPAKTVRLAILKNYCILNKTECSLFINRIAEVLGENLTPPPNSTSSS